jgi:hypothetical protein
LIQFPVYILSRHASSTTPALLQTVAKIIVPILMKEFL